MSKVRKSKYTYLVVNCPSCEGEGIYHSGRSNYATHCRGDTEDVCEYCKGKGSVTRRVRKINRPRLKPKQAEVAERQTRRF